ncbi:LysR family transcriptional regulator [Aminipila luticellarii]|uniref:LysR family transcriptional regulator n=1 Tax=Aminipila luticellarii TaxID=2507160 RepID=A0A410PV26_9FIRM|nr:LysR family transcriptional regulator [Aminipila luticellarii]QAT42797.1 LysR family transcriptional regulator [Aminipila luticellarii]
MLDFRVETFITVCEYMNFTKAAERLNITQPAVSQHIRYMEDVYGTKLFEFTGKKMKLTDSGKLLLNTFITMKHDEIHLKEQIKEGFRESKTIHFGATLTIGEFLIPRQICQYLKTNPQVSLKMLVANTSELLEKLDKGEIDFAVVEGYFTKSQYDHRLYSREDYIAVCAANHFFKKEPEQMEDLFSETIILREDGSGTREILERALEGKNYALSDFKNKVEVSNMNVIKFLTKEDCGITFLYEAAVKDELKAKTLRKVHLKDLNIQHDMTFIWRKNSIFTDYYCKLFKIFQTF